MFRWRHRFKKVSLKNRLLVGWCEWCELPGLSLPPLQVKIDSGARTSALHATNIKPFTRDGLKMVEFDIHPHRDDDNIYIHCEAPVVDERHIKSSNGHEECRFVINTLCQIGDKTWDIELTLTDRSLMRFRMLLGRTAMHQGGVIIDPGEKYLHGKYTS